MSTNFRAFVFNQTADGFKMGIERMKLRDLPPGEVLIQVAYSLVNYKDALACILDGRVARTYPLVPGLELAGVIVESTDSRFKAGDTVRAYEQCNQEFRKQERYCKEQRDLLRALEDLKASERVMYELDDRKDQVMTVFKVALTNLVMWIRDQYFPASFAHATLGRLAPFFQLQGESSKPMTWLRWNCVPSMINGTTGISLSSVNE